MVKKKSQEENIFKSLFNIINRLNTSTKVSEKKEEMAEYKKKHCCCCFEEFIKHKCLLCTCIITILIPLAVAIVILMVIMVLILMAYGNKQEEVK
jgi:hypothetical protein